MNVNDSKVLKVMDGVTQQQKPTAAKTAARGPRVRRASGPPGCPSRTGPGADRGGGEHFAGPDDVPATDSLVVGKTAYVP